MTSWAFATCCSFLAAFTPMGCKSYSILNDPEHNRNHPSTLGFPLKYAKSFENKFFAQPFPFPSIFNSSIASSMFLSSVHPDFEHLSPVQKGRRTLWHLDLSFPIEPCMLLTSAPCHPGWDLHRSQTPGPKTCLPSDQFQWLSLHWLQPSRICWPEFDCNRVVPGTLVPLPLWICSWYRYAYRDARCMYYVLLLCMMHTDIYHNHCLQFCTICLTGKEMDLH